MSEKFVINEMTVKVSSIRPNTWNPKDSVDDNAENQERFETIKRMMSEHGQMAVIVVRENKNGDSLYEVIDGYHRWRAAKELGWEQVKINNLGKVADEKAKALTIMFERAKVETNPTKEAQLIKELYEVIPSFEDLANILPFSADVIKNKVELVDFDWGNMEKEGSGEPKVEGDGAKFSFKVGVDDVDVCNEALNVADSEGDKDAAFVAICKFYLNNIEKADDGEEEE